MSVSLIFLRLFPPVVRGVAIFTARFGPAWAAIATWRWISQVARTLEIPLEEGVAAWPPDGQSPGT